MGGLSYCRLSPVLRQSEVVAHFATAFLLANWSAPAVFSLQNTAAKFTLSVYVPPKYLVYYHGCVCT